MAADFKPLSEFVLACGLIWLFECLCMCVCSLKESKDRLACNSLLITVIFPQLCSASVVMRYYFEKPTEERTAWQQRESKRSEQTTAVCRQNEPSFRWLDILAFVVLIDTAMRGFYRLPISLPQTHSHSNAAFLSTLQHKPNIDLFQVHMHMSTCFLSSVKVYTESPSLPPHTHTHTIDSFSLAHTHDLLMSVHPVFAS